MLQPMNVNIQTRNFNAKGELIDFSNKRLEKLSKFHDGIVKVELVPIRDKIDYPLLSCVSFSSCSTFCILLQFIFFVFVLFSGNKLICINGFVAFS